MQTLESYRANHAQLREMIEELRSVMTIDNLKIRPNAKTAYQMVCGLAEKVRDHLAEEDKGLYPSLLIHQDPTVKSIAWGFISGEKPLRKTFDDYHKKWLKNCDFNFTEEFVAETNEMFAMLLSRIEREENILFPKLQEIGVLALVS
jgi:hemerythrin-like domain-containing protein